MSINYGITVKVGLFTPVRVSYGPRGGSTVEPLSAPQSIDGACNVLRAYDVDTAERCRRNTKAMLAQIAATGSVRGALARISP